MSQIMNSSQTLQGKLTQCHTLQQESLSIEGWGEVENELRLKCKEGKRINEILRYSPGCGNPHMDFPILDI